MKRKLIILITTCPEEPYQQHAFRGIFEQCAKYGYQLAVFATNVQAAHYYQEYLRGDADIYDAINFDLADGVIVTSVPVSHNHHSLLEPIIIEKLQKECKAKVVCMDMSFGDYETVYTDDKLAIKRITEHVIQEHGCRRIYCLTGYREVDVSMARVEGYREALLENGLEYREEDVFYGNFWYAAGENMAEKIAAGELEKPDAVVCANDNMATGLVNRLVAKGIRVPEDVIVTGYDAISEAFMNETTITTYAPDIFTTGAEAVNRIRAVIEPDAPIADIEVPKEFGIVYGDSCGCTNKNEEVQRYTNSFVFHINRGYETVDDTDPNDIGRLTDSYMFESLISSKSEQELLEGIDIFSYLIKPFKEFFLVLREDWKVMGVAKEPGYPEKMRLMIHRTVEHEFENRVHPLFTPDDTEGERTFDRSLMLPDLHEETDTPCVYYFTPLHFQREPFGYTVLKCDLKQDIKIGAVYRNWVRNVSNALEMGRVRARLMDDSNEDVMTGLLNRRGMYNGFRELERKRKGKELYIIMVDMDRLKDINDNFGHDEGDFGIRVIAEAIREHTQKGDVCVRSGGDEFLVIGCADSAKEVVERKTAEIRKAVEEKAAVSGKPYPISVSLGYVISDSENVELDALIKAADEQMYDEKKAKHARRCE